MEINVFVIIVVTSIIEEVNDEMTECEPKIAVLNIFILEKNIISVGKCDSAVNSTDN